MDGLPFSDEREYVLQVQTRDGSGTRKLSTFNSREGLNGILVNSIAAGVVANVLRWEIATVAGEVLLRSA